MKITLKSARINAGLTQQEIADIIGVSVPTIANWERGKTKPNNAELEMLSNKYNIAIGNIFFHDNITLSGKESNKKHS